MTPTQVILVGGPADGSTLAIDQDWRYLRLPANRSGHYERVGGDEHDGAARYLWRLGEPVTGKPMPLRHEG